MKNCIDCNKELKDIRCNRCRDCWKAWSKVSENNGFYGKKHKKSSLEQISRNHRDIFGNNNPMKKLSSRRKLSILNSGSGNAMFGIKGKNHPRFGKNAWK